MFCQDHHCLLQYNTRETSSCHAATLVNPVMENFTDPEGTGFTISRLLFETKNNVFLFCFVRIITAFYTLDIHQRGFVRTCETAIL